MRKLIIISLLLLAACKPTEQELQMMEDYKDWQANARVVKICSTTNNGFGESRIIYKWRGELYLKFYGQKVESVDVCQ